MTYLDMAVLVVIASVAYGCIGYSAAVLSKAAGSQEPKPEPRTDDKSIFHAMKSARRA